MTAEGTQGKPGVDGASARGDDVDTAAAQPPEQWRSATLNALGALAVLGGTGLLILSLLTVKGSEWVIVSGMGILLGVAVMIGRQRLSLQTRGGILAFAFLSISALSTQLLGPVPASILLITAAAVVARLFIGARAALLATVLGSINFLALGITYRADSAVRLGSDLLGITPWVRMAGATALLTTIIVLTLGRALNRLEASLADARLALARATDEQRARERAEESRHESLRKHDAAVEASRVKSEFVASMSHELRTPLNAVLGFAHLALRTDLSEQQRTYLNGIAGASQALLAVVNAVLDLSKIEAGKLIFAVTPFTVADLRTRVESVLAVQAGQKGIALRLQIAADVPAVLEGDLNRLSQVLINLGSNGIKFTEQGAVDITIACVDRDDDGVALAFAVRDTGIGMTAAQVSKLFEPFTQATATTAQQYGGTGLGLAISKRIVEQLGGRMDVESVPAKGTSVNFTLRLRTTTAIVAAAAPAAVDATDSAGEKSLAGVRVLVADDVEINRQIAREILASAGATVDFAVDGAEAARAVASSGVPYDVVLMDVQMPVMDGLEATLQIRAGAVGEKVPIVALSAHAFETEKRKCLDAGMNAYMAKPIEPAELIALLHRLARERP